MLKKLFILVAFQLSLLSYTSASYAITIKIGHNDTSYDQAAAALFKVVFERSGYNVAETQGDPDLLLSMLDRGEINFYLCAWLPNRDADSFSPYSENLKLITRLYENASSFFAVPRYIPRSLINTVEDLSKPEVLEKMNATILVNKQDSSLVRQAERSAVAYDLESSGYGLQIVASDAWDENIDNQLEKKIWFVTPMTKPHLLNLSKKFRKLKDPKKSFAQKDTAWLVSNSKTEKRIASHIFEIVTKMELSTKWIAELEQMAEENNWPHYVAARVWMAAHPYTVEYWISSE